MKKLLCTILISLTLFGFAQNKINRYEFWFDNNYAARTATTITPVVNFTLNTAIATTGLQPGLHVIHFRFRDDSARWSSAVSQFFQKLPTPTSTTVTLTGYEYWFDNNYSGRIYTAIGAQQNFIVSTALSASSLPVGLHVIHMRFKDSEGKWSSAVSQFFHKLQNTTITTNEIVEYQYWYDNNFAGAISSAIGPAQNISLAAPISASALNPGLHVIHMRFKDNTGKWSSAISQFFQKTQSSTATTIELTNYQYWFDNNYAAAVTQSVAPQENIVLLTAIATPSLQNGLHVLHIRFKDNTGKWSVTESQFFHKVDVTTIATNTVTDYRYWFDAADSNMVNVSIPPAPDVTENASLSMIMLPSGIHTLHLQFRDTLGMWSSPTTDSVFKMPLLIAMFDSNDTLFCDSGTVAFMDHSIDANSYMWYFGDGDSSALPNPVHQYNQPGLYNVTLTISDSVSGNDTSLTLNQFIRVYSTPSPALTSSPNDSLCAGQTATISASAGASYLWNTTDTSQSIQVTASGDYWSVVSNIQYAACNTNSDTVHITIMPLPVVNLGSDTSICQGTQLLLDATNSGASYNWNTGSTGATILVDSASSYWVIATSSFGCTASDSIVVGVDSLPNAAFAFTGNNMQVNFTNQSQHEISWFWDFGDSNTSNLENPTHTYAMTGTFVVTLIVTNNCGSDTITDVVVITGIHETNIVNNISVFAYPNPASDHLNIVLSSATSEDIAISLFDVAGKMVVPQFQSHVNAAQMQTVVLNTSELSDGVYLLRIVSGDQAITTQIVIAK